MAVSIPGLLMLAAPVALALVMLGAIELIVRIETRRERLQTGAGADRRAGADISANDAMARSPLARSPWDFDDRSPFQASMTWIEDGPPRRDPRAGRRF